MSTPRLVELAKEGHPQAIARLINQQLKSRGVTAIASRQGNCLRLLLEAPKQPNETVLVPYLCKALTKLGSPEIHQVELYGRKQGDARGWQTDLKQLDRQFVVNSDSAQGLQLPRSKAVDQGDGDRTDREHKGMGHKGMGHDESHHDEIHHDGIEHDEIHHGGSRLLSQAADARRRRAQRAKFVTPVPDMDSMDSLEQALISPPKSAPSNAKSSSQSSTRPRAKSNASSRRFQTRPEPQLPRWRQSRLSRSAPLKTLRGRHRSPAPIRSWQRFNRSLKTPTDSQPEPQSPDSSQTAATLLEAPTTPCVDSPPQKEERGQTKEQGQTKERESLYQPKARPEEQVETQTEAQFDTQSDSARASRPWLMAKALGLWLSWQWAAWSTTLLLVMMVVPILMLALFSVFSLLNRFEEQFMMLFSLGGLAFVPLLGLLLGDAQTRLLRKRLHNIGGWRWMTMLGVVLGFLIAVGSHFAIATVFAPVVSDPNPEFVIGRGLPFVASTLGVGLGCLILGFLQWLMISTSIAKSYLWPVATSLGSIISWVAGMLMSAAWLGPRFFPTAVEPSNFWSTLFLWMAGGLVSWLLFHALSGTVMAALLRDLPRLDRLEFEADGSEDSEMADSTSDSSRLKK